MRPNPPTVHLHIGAPKTGTTYLQAVAANNRGRLKAQGLLYPGPGKDHFLAVQDVRGGFKGYDDPRIAGSWSRLLQAIESWSGSAVLVSHEILAAATPDEIGRIVAELPTDDVRVVMTVRDFARQLPAVWQEDLKNGATVTLHQFLRRVQRGPSPSGGKLRGFWRWQDLPAILQGWQRHVPAERITVVTVPPKGASPSLLWKRFAAAIEVDPAGADLQVPRTNSSLDAASAEVIRRLNVALTSEAGSSVPWPLYRREVKKFLAERVLAGRRDSPQLAIGPRDFRWAVEFGREVATAVEQRGYRLVGDLGDLTPPVPETTARRTSADPADARDAAVAALTAYLPHVAELRGHP